MKVLLLVAGLLLCILPLAFSRKHWTTDDDSDLYGRYFNSERIRDECSEKVSCTSCHSLSSCSWCVGSTSGGQCKASVECPEEEQQPCQAPQDSGNYRENQAASRYYEDASVNVTANASLCAQNTNCSECTASQCLWCEKKRQCVAYYNDTSASTACQSNLWYKKQCTYAATTKPCPLRQSGCKECIKGDICYWCDSTKKCAFYPHKNYVPPQCALDDMYYKRCTHMKLIIVLIPVLCIVLIPVITYIVLWLIMCCMKAAGYNNLKNEPEKDEPPIPKKEKPKPIRLHHEPPRSKTDELRKKYGIGR